MEYGPEPQRVVQQPQRYVSRVPSGRESRAIDQTMGVPTKAMCPASWIHHRPVMGTALCVNAGMTTRDITIQINGP